MRGVKSKREGSDLDCIFSFHRVQEAGRKAGSVEEGRQKEEEGRKAHTDRQTTFARTREGGRRASWLRLSIASSRLYKYPVILLRIRLFSC